MHWFKIVLLVILIASVLANLVDVKRSKPKEPSPITAATNAVIVTLLAIGLWVYL